MTARRVVAAVVMAVGVIALPAVPAHGWVPPTSAPVIDRFRPPSSPYGPGNRGWAYASVPGSPVVAAGAGVVTFAGPIAGAWFVTVAHPDGLRTSYSYLREVRVRAGETVATGSVVGTATDHLHFGVRDPDGTYIDPALLLSGPVAVVDGAVLLPDGGQARGAGSAAPGEPGEPGEPGAPRPVASARVALRAWASPPGCVPAGSEGAGGPEGTGPPPDPPVPPAEVASVVVLVGGLGSTSEVAGIDRVDLAGIPPDRIVRFSYAGGRVPDPTDAPALQAVPAHPYAPGDTFGPVDTAAERLADLLVAVHDAEPGRPIVVVAHSLGGVVADRALDRLPPAPAASVVVLVTIASPHRGAPLADALRRGRAAEVDGLLQVAGLPLRADAPVLADLATGAADGVGHGPTPARSGRTRVIAIAGSGDLVVPARRATLDGAENVIVPVHGLHAHDALPAAPAVGATVRRALAGSPLPCPSPGLVALGTAESLLVERIENRAAGGHDPWISGPPRPAVH